MGLPGMLFIDNPVGAGFSYTTNNGYVTNEDEVAQNLQSELAQFFSVFPKLQSNKFFITGESYGGQSITNYNQNGAHDPPKKTEFEIRFAQHGQVLTGADRC